MPFAKTPKLDAVLVYLAVRCLGSVALAMYAVVASVYRIAEAGLDPLQLILVGTVLEVSTFVFEIPTGVVSDVYSRRLSLIIGAFLVGAGFIVEGLFPVFGAVLAAQFLWGVGSTFGSGAEQAWIADETGGERIGQVFMRGSQFAQVGSLVGIAAGVALASGYVRLPVPDLALPLLTGGSIYVALGLLMAITMPEDGFRPASRRDMRSWTTMAQIIVAGVRIVRRRPTLAAILAIALFYGASSEPIDRLWNLHLLMITDFSLPALPLFEPVAWWGIIDAASLLLGIVAVEAVRRTIDIDDPRAAVRLLSLLNACAVVSVLTFALTGSFTVAVVAYTAYKLVRRVGGTAGEAWTNRQLDSGVRATVFSMRAQADAFGQIAAGPAMGIFAAASTIRAALVATAALLAPPQLIYALVGRSGEEPTA